MIYDKMRKMLKIGKNKDRQFLHINKQIVKRSPEVYLISVCDNP
jgi:hypothetical protein